MAIFWNTSLGRKSQHKKQRDLEILYIHSFSQAFRERLAVEIAAFRVFLQACHRLPELGQTKQSLNTRYLSLEFSWSNHDGVFIILHEVSPISTMTHAVTSWVNMARDPRGFVEEHFNKVFEFFIKFSTINPTFFAVVCLVIVILGSLICDHHQLPEFYLSNKRSIFNVLFAKWSMAWTLASLTPFMVVTWWEKSKNNLKVVSKCVLRLVVAFMIWFVVTVILDFIEHASGECEGSDLYSSKYECLREGLLWNGLDISGHSFILSYCTLIIGQEIQVIRFWTDKNTPKKSISPKEEFVVSCYVRYGLYMLCCLLMLLWIMLLAITSLYFHTVATKVLGVGLGLSSWFFTYEGLFLSKYFPQVSKGW